MKTVTRSVIVGALLGLSSFAFADTTKKVEVKALHATGTFVSADATKNEVTLSVKTKGKAEDQVFTVAADGKVELAGKTSTLADLVKGETVKITYSLDGTNRNASDVSATPLAVKKTTTTTTKTTTPATPKPATK